MKLLLKRAVLLLVNRIWTDVEVCHTHLVAVEADSTNNQTCPIHFFPKKVIHNWLRLLLRVS